MATPHTGHPHQAQPRKSKRGNRTETRCFPPKITSRVARRRAPGLGKGTARGGVYGSSAPAAKHRSVPRQRGLEGGQREAVFPLSHTWHPG